jgi:hypothetical protein
MTEPVVDDVLSIVLRKEADENVEEFEITRLVDAIEVDVRSPPTTRFFVIATPPATISAPVVGEVL